MALHSKIARLIEEHHPSPGIDPTHIFLDKLWPALQDDYDTMRHDLQEFCNQQLKRIKCKITSRTKTRDSIQKSLVRRQAKLPGNRFHDLEHVLREIHDLVGLRIVLDFPDDIEKATGIINVTFHKESEPTTFGRNREVGNFWKNWFGAYQTCNHRVSLKPESCDEKLSLFSGVLFEIQLTTLPEDLYNRLAHPLLYKGSSALTRQDEMVIDMAHGNALCYALTLCYMKDKLNGDQEALPAHGVVDSAAQIVDATTAFSRGLAELVSAQGLGSAKLESVPEEFNSIKDLKQWLEKKLDEMNCPQSLRSRLQWEEAPFTVPYTSNQDFVGRTEILDRLKVQFGHRISEETHRRNYQPRSGLYGLGGVGKTQIALKYLYWLRDTYPQVSIFWVHASTAERFRDSYGLIAKECKIPGSDHPNADLLRLVKEWLECRNGHRWLMVIDNADDAELFTPPEGLGKYIPEYAHGSVLVTTRNKVAGSRLVQGRQVLIEIGHMNDTDSIDLLQLKLGASEANTNALATLSARLEHLPLALVQASAFIQENNISVEGYLELLDRSDANLVELLSQEFETVGRDSDSRRAVAETWVLSFDQIQHQNPLSAELLSLMSLFDRQSIPHEFLQVYIHNHPGHNRAARGDVEYVKSLGVLKAFSFIQEDKEHGGKEQKFTMHRLVQLAMRKWLDRKGAISYFADHAFFAILQSYPDAEHGGWGKCRSFLPHIYAVLSLPGTDSNEAKMSKARLCRTAGLFLDIQGHYKQAERLFAQCHDLFTDVLGENSLDTLGTRYNLARNFYLQGRYREAELRLNQVLQMQKQLLGENHEDTILTISMLGLTCQQQGRYAEAEPLIMEALEFQRRVLGDEHHLTLHPMHNLAATYMSQGRYSEAEMLYLETVEKRRRLLGEEHPDTLLSMNNLADTWWSLNRWDDAEELMQRCLRLMEKALGPEHPNTLMSMRFLAYFWWQRGRNADAEELMRRCLKLREKVLGPHHPHTVDSRKVLSIWLSEGHPSGDTLSQGEGPTSHPIAPINEASPPGQTALGPKHTGNLIASVAAESHDEMAARKRDRLWAMAERLLGRLGQLRRAERTRAT